MEFILPMLLILPTSALVMIGAGLSISLFISTLMYLVSYFFQSPQMTAIAKEEYAALLCGIIIIFFWFSADAFFNGLSAGLVSSSLPEAFQQFLSFRVCSSPSAVDCIGGITNSHISLAIGSLDIMIQRLTSQYFDLFLFEALIGFLSTITFPIGSPMGPVAIISFSLTPFAGLNLLSQAHTVVVETISYLLTVIWAKRFILIFARDAVPLLLLPMGLVLRAVPFYRKTGSSVLALAFALYFVFPFSVILSNYLIFDIYQPVDFTYTPSTASFFGTERSADDWEGDLRAAQGGPGTATETMQHEFDDPDVVSETYNDPSNNCQGNVIFRMFCSAKNIVSTGVNAISSFASAVSGIWRFMMGMSGDFVTLLTLNPALPTSSSAGLYYFIIREVNMISPFVILTILVTVIEITFTVTAYRSISLLIGGEAELIGLTKIV